MPRSTWLKLAVRLLVGQTLVAVMHALAVGGPARLAARRGGRLVARLRGPALVGLLGVPPPRRARRFWRAPLTGACSALRTVGSRPFIYLVAVLVSVPLQLFSVFQMHLLLLALHAPAGPYRLTW